jgi:hypothetical protein
MATSPENAPARKRMEAIVREKRRTARDQVRRR